MAPKQTRHADTQAHTHAHRHTHNHALGTDGVMPIAVFQRQPLVRVVAGDTVTAGATGCGLATDMEPVALTATTDARHRQGCRGV